MISSSAACIFQAWAQTEGGLLRGAASYCMDRFQRYPCSRLGFAGVIGGYGFDGLIHLSMHGRSHEAISDLEFYLYGPSFN